MTFLAGLELTRRRLLFLRQAKPFAELWMYRREEGGGEPTHEPHGESGNEPSSQPTGDAPPPAETIVDPEMMEKGAEA
jgi:hypothetical protein